MSGSPAAPCVRRMRWRPGSNEHQRSPLLHVDPDGNIWLAFKRRYSRMAFRAAAHIGKRT